MGANLQKKRSSREKDSYYYLITSTLGDVGIVWRYDDKAAPLIVGVTLPLKDVPTTAIIRNSCPDIMEGLHPDLSGICDRIRSFLEGACADFSTEFLNIGHCRDFQRRVLLETMKIPRGSVTSYGILAKAIPAPGAARAVGSALAKNPFPIIIPCHRVVRSDGYVGQFGGGIEAKKTLLRMEGVEIDSRSKVDPETFYMTR